MKVAQLKEELGRRGLPVGGRKAELAARLTSAQLDSSDQQGEMPKSGKAPSKPSRKARHAATGPAVLLVESPAKCATIAKFSGDRFVVLACNGHVRSLPSRANSVRPQEGFAMDFELVKGGGGVLSKIGAALKGARALYLATDPDREGEAIAWHVVEALRERGKLPVSLPIHRISFSSITQPAITAALEAPRSVNLQLVHAQQARQALDYLVGFSLSPVLWRKLPGCRSAGRVQSVALRLIVEREHAVLRFEPREHWSIYIDVAVGAGARASLSAKLTHDAAGDALRQFSVPNEAEAAALAESLPPAWAVRSVTRTERRRQPPPPFNTASLQMDASRRLGLPVGRVMRFAQSLYEGGLITYMRTDGVEMAPEAIEGARQYVGATYGEGEEWLPAEPRVYTQKSRNAQEAHEAIRPVTMDVTPQSLGGSVAPKELALYGLIWRRALASQMAAAVHEVLSVGIEPDGAAGGGLRARASGSRLKQPGYRALYLAAAEEEAAARADAAEEDVEAEEELGGAAEDGAGGEAEVGLDPLLETLAKGDVLSVVERQPTQHFTEPPPRFSEGSLVRNMEQLGVGRPSTYASVLRSLSERGYVTAVGKALRPLQKGELCNALLTGRRALETYVRTDFTARLEDELDAISSGDLEREARRRALFELCSASANILANCGRVAQAFLRAWWAEFEPAVAQLAESDTREVRAEVAEEVAWTLFPPAAGAVAEAGAADAAASASPADAARACPQCGTGHMELKFSRCAGGRLDWSCSSAIVIRLVPPLGRFGPFVGCSEYPSCGWTRRTRDIASESSGAAGEELAESRVVLGVLAAHAAGGGEETEGLEVSLRDGPVGW